MNSGDESSALSRRRAAGGAGARAPRHAADVHAGAPPSVSRLRRSCACPAANAPADETGPAEFVKPVGHLPEGK